MAWYTTRLPDGRARSTETVEFGPDAPDGVARRLLGDLDSRRVLELGSGAGNSALSMAKANARVIAVEPDREQIAAARELFEQSEVRVEQHNSDLADLAFLRADGFDIVVSCYELSRVGDLDRVFRQVHRVLRPEALFVFSLPHPMGLVQSHEIPYRAGEIEPGRYLHRISDLCSGLTRANFRIENVIETDRGPVPRTLIVKARKEGV